MDVDRRWSVRSVRLRNLTDIYSIFLELLPIIPNTRLPDFWKELEIFDGCYPHNIPALSYTTLLPLSSCNNKIETSNLTTRAQPGERQRKKQVSFV